MPIVVDPTHIYGTYAFKPAFDQGPIAPAGTGNVAMPPAMAPPTEGGNVFAENVFKEVAKEVAPPEKEQAPAPTPNQQAIP